MDRSQGSPVELLAELGQAMDSIAARRDAEHVQRMHVPPKRTDPLQAIPFAEDRIPDVELAQMVELLTTSNMDLAAVARMYNYPLPLVERELAEYKGRWKHFLLGRATA